MTEEPQEREFDIVDAGIHYFRTLLDIHLGGTVLWQPLILYTVDDYQPSIFRDSLDRSSPVSPTHADSDFDREMGSEGYASRSSSKKQRSGDFSLPGVSGRFGTRFPSFSKRWKNKSGAGPKLSIVTHSDQPGSRTSSAGSSQLISPALSAISKHESYLPPSPVGTAFEDIFRDSAPAVINIDEPLSEEETQDQAQATTPLLPPLLMDFSKDQSPIQSPLQSPAIAQTSSISGSTTPVSTPQLHTLPSPPLSAKPSIGSFQQRSWADTMTKSLAEVPPMQMLDQQNDEWSQKLGHADFTIVPKPYLPDIKDLDAYRQLRADWDLARSSYGKHLARTGEHYGTTSKVYVLTEEKWAVVDAEWKKHNDAMTRSVQSMIARLSDGDTDQGGSAASSAVLEKPVTKVVVPQINDSSGKFPMLGDEDIIGPMAFAPSRFQQTDVEQAANHRSTRKRTFIKFISDILGRGSGQRTMT